MTGNLVVFLELRHDISGFSHITTVNSGSLWCGPREVQSPLELQGGVWHCSRVTEGNQASRHVEGGILKCFSSWGRKPWDPLTCEGDLRELLTVTMGIQELWSWKGPLGTTLGSVQWKRA